jgi:hypothetical protein
MAGSCEYGDEPSGSGATELVIISLLLITVTYQLTHRDLSLQEVVQEFEAVESY